MQTFKFNWGHGIAIFFTCFVVFILTAVFTSTKENIHLVTEDYYAKELAYQERIDEINNAKSLNTQVKMNVVDGSLQITFPKEVVSADITGNIHFFRPSDSKLDQLFTISLNELGVQDIKLNDMVKGHYRIKLDWVAKGQAYFFEEPIFIQ
ncbi:MAG: FixH family protein [Bacteroidota bacterium]